MNKWDISGALSGADPQLVEAAAPEKARELMGDEAVPKAEKKGLGRLIRKLIRAVAGAFRKHKFLRIAVPVLAVLALAVILDGTFHIRSGLTLKAYALGQAEHPEKEDHRDDPALNEARGSGIPLADFFTDSMAEILGGADTKGNHANRLYSPINSYMALAMLAECTGGESREEVLQLLGADSIESLRKQASAIYLANTMDFKDAKCVLYNSLWLGEGISYREETVKTLAETYLASTFRGKMGSEGYNKALRAWITEATDGLMPERYVKNVSMRADTLMMLVSAVNLDVKWDGFKKSDSHPGTFHSPDGQRSVTYMHQDIDSTLYVLGDSFQATFAEMSSRLRMWLILPNEGISPEELLQDETYQTFVKMLMEQKINYSNEDGEDLAWKNLKVHLDLPRFDISAENDLIDNFRRLGLTKTLSRTQGDFSGLLTEPAYITDFKQASRLIADEEGVRAVSFFVIGGGKSDMPLDEVSLTFDRPFLFLLMSQNNVPLYAGIVNQP